MGRLGQALGLGAISLLLVAPLAAEEDPLECPIRAVLLEEDAGLRRVWDGIRKGLEQAALPRVCLEEARDADSLAAVRGRLQEAPPPLLFVLGAGGEARLPKEIPSPVVYVEIVWLREDGDAEAMPPPPGAMRVRGVLRTARLGEVVRDLLPGRPRPRALFPPAAPPAASASERDRFARAVGVEPAPSGGEADLILHLGALGARATRPSDPPWELARRRGIPLVSDDLSHWRRGATVLLLPEHFLLGRVAAEMGRRMLAGREAGGRVQDVTACEVRVDLDAARAQGLRLPLPFLAGADVLRRTARPPAREGGPR